MRSLMNPITAEIGFYCLSCTAFRASFEWSRRFRLVRRLAEASTSKAPAILALSSGRQMWRLARIPRLGRAGSCVVHV